MTLMLLCATFLFSCRERTENKKQNKEETPKALQDDKLEIKSFGRSGDLTDQLYAGLVDKSPALKRLEDNLDLYMTKPGELAQALDKYDSKSNSYYNSADAKVKAIQDSLLRKQILDLITASKNQYGNKTAEIKSLLNVISQKGSTLNDHHTVLKILLTLPLIEKYQNENLPDNKLFKNLIEEQEGLIQQVDSLKPAY